MISWCQTRQMMANFGGWFAVALLLMGFFFVSAQVALAAPVTQATAWTKVAGTAGDGTSLSGSFTAGAGSNRLLVVTVTAEFNSAVNFAVSSATYGGQALTELTNNSPAGEGQFAIWVGYLNEADVAAASDSTLTVNWSDNANATSRNMFAAVFADANQVKPFRDFSANATALDAPISFGSDIDYLREGKVIYIGGYGGTNTGTTHVTGYTERLAAANNDGSVVTAADLDDTSLNGTASGSSALDFGGTNGNHGIVAAAINPFFTPMVHSSASTGSTRWGGSWGVSGGRYGEFTCATCHEKNPANGNIKRVKAVITSPNSPANDFPGSNVTFQTAEAPSSDFGNDSGAHDTSTRVCEICHTYDAAQTSGVKFHAFDMSAGGADLSHENGADCISCHLHNDGFAAGSCDGCHQANGVGHDDTSENLSLHDAHTSSLYTSNCADCHTHNGSGTDHVNGTVNFNNTAIANTYNYTATGQFGGTCGSTNGCHDSDPNEWQNGNLGFAGDNPCQDCHGSSATYFSLVGGWTNSPNAGPTSGEHQDHLGNSGFVSDCSVCHPHNGAMGGQHLDTTLQQTVSYAGNGTCANTCHYVADGRDWTSATALDCADCHDADNAGGQANGYYALDQDGWPVSSGSHTAHVATADNAAYGDLVNHATVGAYEYGCGECHGTTVSNHANGAIDVDSGFGWSGTSCNNTYCHSKLDTDGATRLYVSTPDWGTSFAGDTCAGCHHNSPESAGHEEHQIGFHYDAIYSGLVDSMPVTDTDPVPAGLVTGANGKDQLRGHGGLLDSDRSANSTTMSCYVCHNDTVTAKGNDLNPACATCHGVGPTPPAGTMVVADHRNHVNGTIDIQFVDEKIRSKAQVRDDLTDVPELNNNWVRVNNYKANDGSSYDESLDTLRNTANDMVNYGGWNSASKTCMISCHLWEKDRVDKYPVHWIDNSIHGSQPIMCIDCHTRLPK